MHARGALERTRCSRNGGASSEEKPSLTIKMSQPTRARLLVGMPVITSPVGLHFWLNLCGIANHDRIYREASAQLESPTNTRGVGSASSDGRLGGTTFKPHSEGELPPYGQEWFITTLKKLQNARDLGVDGVHVMAPGAAPRRRLLAMMKAGVFKAL